MTEHSQSDEDSSGQAGVPQDDKKAARVDRVAAFLAQWEADETDFRSYRELAVAIVALVVGDEQPG